MAFLPDSNVWISLWRQIAAIARTHGLTLVSADHEFSRVPGLNVEDWTQA